MRHRSAPWRDGPWDLACRITAKEAGGAVPEFTVDGVVIYSDMFGKPAIVARLCKMRDTA